MSTRSTQKYKTDANGTTFADPSEPDFTVRFKTVRAPKTINGHATENYATEIIISDSHTVALGGDSGADALSVRIRVSGSVNSYGRLKDICSTVAGQLPTWFDENVFLGFEPGTVPLNALVGTGT